MLAKKYPKLKKPINCARRMGLIESIRDYYFHRNLAKVDERMLHEQIKEDGMAEGRAIGIAKGKEIGIAEGKEIGITEGRVEGMKEGELRERNIWQGIVADMKAEKDTEIERLRIEIAELREKS